MKRLVSVYIACQLLSACGRDDRPETTSNLDASSCNYEELKICLKYGGGDACYSKWNCDADDDAKVSLSVPYYYQLNNKYEPYRSCNITSVAMALSYKTKTIKPDQLYQKYGLVFTGSEMASIARAQGATQSVYHAGVGSAKIKSYLDRGIPVIFQRLFTSGSGHIILIVGYDDKGWIVNDPYGEWFASGYEHTPTGGNHVHYSYGLVDRNSLGGSGNYHITAVF